MAARDPELPTIQTLITLAQAQPARALPDETHQSFPVPVPDPRGLRIAFFYCPALLSIHTGLQLLAPRNLALLNAATGKLEELRAMSPGEFGQKHARSDVIGKYDMLPDGRTPEQFRAMYDRLEADYNALLPLLAAGEIHGSQKIKETAAEFCTLFPLLVERPLLPYYEVLGKVFFAWLDKLAA